MKRVFVVATTRMYDDKFRLISIYVLEQMQQSYQESVRNHGLY